MGFDTTLALSSHRQIKDHATARHLIRYMMYNIGYKRYSAYVMSLQKIAEITNSICHSTVIHSIGVAEELIIKDRFFRKMIEDFEIWAMDRISMSKEEFSKSQCATLIELKNLYLCISNIHTADEIKQSIKTRIKNYERKEEQRVRQGRLPA